MKMKGYKGFDKNLKCRDKQYTLGKEESENETKICEKGMHFCELPHEVFNYYSAGNGNRFCEVEAEEVSDEIVNDSKRVAKRLLVKTEISAFDICKMAVSVFFEKFGFKNKIKSAETTNAGDYGAAIVLNNGRVKGGYGCVLVARNIEWNDANSSYEITDWACGIVDNITIKENTWYELLNGRLVKCENQ